MTSPIVLFINHNCYLDDSNGAMVASRQQMEALARHGFAVVALTGSVLELGSGADPAGWLAARGLRFPSPGGTWALDARGVVDEAPPHLAGTVIGVGVTVQVGHPTTYHDPGPEEQAGFLRLFERIAARGRIDVVVGYGGSAMVAEVFARVRARGGRAVFALHNFAYDRRDFFDRVDRVFVPSHFAADHYRRGLGLDCAVLPNIVNPERVRCERSGRGYITFVNPSAEKGVYAFARIADELGRRRPDIPFLLVEGRGTEATVADCGLDLRRHGTVFFLNHPPDPRRFWRETRVCLMPSLWLESQGLVAIEAMLNGIPVVASDRGALPETLGGSGVVLPLPDRLTARTRVLPTPDEVAPWVDALIRLWDDEAEYQAQSRRAVEASARFSPLVVEPRQVAFFESLAGRAVDGPAR